MSELDFGILDNNADFIEKATQMRGAINDLGAEILIFIRCFRI